MNKAERHRMKMVRFKRRIKRFGMWKEDHGQRFINCYRTTSTPCSCMFCDPHKHGKDGLKPKFRDKRRMAA